MKIQCATINKSGATIKKGCATINESCVKINKSITEKKYCKLIRRNNAAN